MQYVWEQRLLPAAEMLTVDGERVEILDPGLLNRNAGPDFFNAKLRVGDRLWAGNVEIHVRASDWHRHGHDADAAYDSVVLHVVARSDCRIARRSDGSLIPQLVMACADDFDRRYRALASANSAAPPCADAIAAMPPLYMNDWLTALAFARLQAKADRVEEHYRRSGSWPEAIYITLARALGFGLNGEPFERLARATPLAAMLKHADSPCAVEGLLMGQAGFLGDDNGDAASAYVASLRREYDFMCHKFGLAPPGPLMWRMARTRPQNFPHRRLAALAAYIAGGFPLASAIVHVTGPEQARELLTVGLPPYWRRRYTFGPESPRASATLSAASVDGLIINLVAPVLYAYGSVCGHHEKTEAAVGLLQSLAPERNSVVAAFVDAGIDCRDAFCSQALVELRRSYCDARKCLRCRIGHRMLRSACRTTPAAGS